MKNAKKVERYTVRKNQFWRKKSKSTNLNFIISLAPSKQIAISSESQVLGRTIRLDMQYPGPDWSTNANINSGEIYLRIVSSLLVLGFRSAAVDIDWLQKRHFLDLFERVHLHNKPPSPWCISKKQFCSVSSKLSNFGRVSAVVAIVIYIWSWIERGG